MQKNGTYCGKVSALGTGGEGIINAEGTTAFVPFCLVGEEVSFKALKVKGNIAYGKIEKVISPSPARVKAPCPVFEKCGGCDLQHIEYSEQLKFKQNLVKTSLEKLGGIKFTVGDCVPCERQYAYRNKLSLPIGVSDNGETVLGFYARHSHRIVPITNCAIHKGWTGEIIRAVKEFATPQNRDFLKHIVVRELNGKFIFALVASRNIDIAPLAKLLDKSFENFTLLLNVNPADTNVIFGKEWHICRGEGFFSAEEGGITYRAGANTFVQVNDGIREKLYSAVINEIADKDTVAIDLYSGGGLLTAMLAKKCKAAYGVEIVQEASDCAERLKIENGLENMHNICGAVEEKLQGVLQSTEGAKRVIVCDPPRKGIQRSAVQAIKNSGADKVVLISCNPATLARDLGLLSSTLREENGALIKCPVPENPPYILQSITPFDMFPQTRHVECVVCLTRKSQRIRQ